MIAGPGYLEYVLTHQFAYQIAPLEDKFLIVSPII